MEQYVGLDVSLKETSLCVVDQTGTTLWQGKCASTRECIDERAGLLKRAVRIDELGSDRGMTLMHFHQGLEPVRRDDDVVVHKTNEVRSADSAPMLLPSPKNRLVCKRTRRNGPEMAVRAVGIDGDGGKHPLGAIEGATENASVAQALLNNLIGRGLDPKVCRLFIITR